MSRSVTVSVPGARRIGLWLLVIVGAIALLLVGIRLGSQLLAPSPATSLTAGSLAQVAVVGGGVYVGTLAADDGGFLRLDRPAVVRTGPAASPGASGESQTIVQALTSDPFDVPGPILIRHDQVVLVAAVSGGSPLEQAYREAMGSPASPAP